MHRVEVYLKSHLPDARGLGLVAVLVPQTAPLDDEPVICRVVVLPDFPAAGLVKVATFVREGVVYLTEREEPMTFTGKKKGESVPPTSAAQGGERRATTGSMPDFAYTGEGVRIADVPANSPAAKAGLQAGDIITIDAQGLPTPIILVVTTTTTLNDIINSLSTVISTLSPGGTVTINTDGSITIQRGA